MRITIEQEEAQKVQQVAKDHGVDEEKLWQVYQEIMERNFFDDLCDVARENEEEIKA